jgi:hypothetical protein
MAQMIDPGLAQTDPSKVNAQLLEYQREDFMTRYRPLEDAAIAEYMKSPEQAAKQAGLAAASPFNRAMGMNERAMGRRGAQMTGDQRSAVRSGLGLAKARGVGNAENLMRRQVRDRNIEGLGTMIGIGKGISGSVNRDMGAASQLQTQRLEAGRNAQQAHKQSTTSTVMGLASIAAMAFF